jgi:hypothetical protein
VTRLQRWLKRNGFAEFVWFRRWVGGEWRFQYRVPYPCGLWFHGSEDERVAAVALDERWPVLPRAVLR